MSVEDSISSPPPLPPPILDDDKGGLSVKVICLGDSAVGKSKLLERFLSDAYKPQQVSTYALTLYKYHTTLDEDIVDESQYSQKVIVDFWDTAGQEMFQALHPSYYTQADACIMVFDSTRKLTYKNLTMWYDELRQYRPEIPCFCAANKIDSRLDITAKRFAFTERNNIPMHYVSAANGTNVVTLFTNAIRAAVAYKKNPTYWADQIYQELDMFDVVKDDERKEKPKSAESNDIEKFDLGS